MNAIRIRQRLNSHIVDLPALAPMVGKDVEIIVIEESPSEEPSAPVSGPKAGSAKGRIKMSADFDAPLDDFSEYM
jgi:hypothetical protein